MEILLLFVFLQKTLKTRFPGRRREEEEEADLEDAQRPFIS